MSPVSPERKAPSDGARWTNGSSWGGCLFSQRRPLNFLPSVLPAVFNKFNIEQKLALKLAGTVVMLYTATAMIGTYAWSCLSRRFGVHRVVTFLLILGILSQASLALTRGIIDFTVLRMIQTGLVAAIIPLAISIFASESRGNIIAS